MIFIHNSKLSERAHSVLGGAGKYPLAEVKTPHLVATRDNLASQLVAEHDGQPIALDNPYFAIAGLEVHGVQARGSDPDEHLPSTELGRRNLHQRRALGTAVATHNVCKHGPILSWTANLVTFK
jgi:hypothetical protein